MIEALARKAIAAALANDWQKAKLLNEEILARSPSDVAALNRLAMAQAQLGQISQAKKSLKGVLALDPFNPIAIKNLRRLRSLDKGGALKKGGSVTPLPTSLFLEEPGKTKVVTLLKPAIPKVLSTLRIGGRLKVTPRGKALVVKTQDKVYVGTLPDDLSRYLSALIKAGNRYEFFLRSTDPKKVSILIREVSRGRRFAGIPSFLDKTKAYPIPQIKDRDKRKKSPKA